MNLELRNQNEECLKPTLSALIFVMPTRRQEKIARQIKEIVSDCLTNHLNDPRIEGFISVTRIEMPSKLRVADVYLTIFNVSEKGVSKTLKAINSARGRLQSMLADRLASRYCPHLNFHLDEGFKKTLGTMNIIDDISRELEEKDSFDQEDE